MLVKRFIAEFDDPLDMQLFVQEVSFAFRKFPPGTHAVRTRDNLAEVRYQTRDELKFIRRMAYKHRGIRL